MFLYDDDVVPFLFLVFLKKKKGKLISMQKHGWWGRVCNGRIRHTKRKEEGRRMSESFLSVARALVSRIEKTGILHLLLSYSRRDAAACPLQTAAVR